MLVLGILLILGAVPVIFMGQTVIGAALAALGAVVVIIALVMAAGSGNMQSSENTELLELRQELEKLETEIDTDSRQIEEFRQRWGIPGSSDFTSEIVELQNKRRDYEMLSRRRQQAGTDATAARMEELETRLKQFLAGFGDVWGYHVCTGYEFSHSGRVIVGQRSVHSAIVPHNWVDEKRRSGLPELAYELFNVVYLFNGSNVPGINAVKIDVFLLELRSDGRKFVSEVYAVECGEAGVIRKQRSGNAAAFHACGRQYGDSGSQRTVPHAGKILYSDNSLHNDQFCFSFCGSQRHSAVVSA